MTTSHSDRLDRDGELRAQLAALTSITDSPAGGFLIRVLGLSSHFEDLRSLSSDVRALLGGLEKAAELLPPLGWLVFEMGSADAYARAADLVEAGQVEEGEAHLVANWNESDGLSLRWSVQRVQDLYSESMSDYRNERLAQIGHERACLISEAIDNHRDERYASAIQIALSQIDGICTDFSDEEASFFSRDRKTHEPSATVTDEVTLAGHPSNLRAFSKLLTERCETTEVSGRLQRHGIAHGRELGYGTLENSTKALAALLAVITWAKPLAQARLDDERTGHEERYAGSTERDANGRRLDRRGFRVARNAAQSAAGWQMNFYSEHDRYARSKDEFDRGLQYLMEGADTAASADGKTFWTWAIAQPANYVLALGGRDGEPLEWQYAGDTIPQGGPPGEGWFDPYGQECPDWIF